MGPEWYKIIQNMVTFQMALEQYKSIQKCAHFSNCAWTI